MRTLILAWSTALIALAAFGTWLWLSPLPKVEAKPVQPVIVEGESIPLTTGPIAIDLKKAKASEDCLASC